MALNGTQNGPLWKEGRNLKVDFLMLSLPSFTMGCFKLDFEIRYVVLPVISNL